MNILVCPLCRGALELKINKEDSREIVSGNLYCLKCRIDYPIDDTIPNMLPPDMR
jgi:uncharacterized protein YbaR (Trm112 family)